MAAWRSLAGVLPEGPEPARNGRLPGRGAVGSAVVAGAGGPSVYTTIVPGVPAAHDPPGHPPGRVRAGKNRGEACLSEKRIYMSETLL